MPDRRKSYERRMREAGFVKITVWASPNTAEVIKQMAEISRRECAPRESGD